MLTLYQIVKVGRTELTTVKLEEAYPFNFIPLIYQELDT